MENGNSAEVSPTTEITAEERVAWAKQGVAQIGAGVKVSDIKVIVQALRDHDKFIQEVTLPANGRLIPK